VTDLNSPINSLIQEIETKFQAIKAAKESELAPKLNLAKTSTDNLQGRIQGKVDDPELNSAIAKTTDILARNKAVVKDEIETLKQENEALASALADKLQQLNLPESDLSELTKAIQDWLNEINKILENLGSLSEFNQTTDSILLNIKDKLTQLSPILESEGTLETLLCEIKAEMKKVIGEPDLADFSKKIDDLATEQKPVESILAINLHLDKLIQEIKPKVSTNVDLSQEVQEELAKLIILAGKAQVEVAKVQLEVEKAQVEVEKAQEVNVKADTKVKPKVIKAALKAKDSSSNRIAQIKAVSGYLEIAIDALIGTPYLPLARKLQFESKSRLRGSWGQVLNIGDTFYYDVKVPTKVVLGVISCHQFNLQ
jgi:chromosome segregation ATPase